MSQYADMKIAGLKLELRRRHLQVSGNKSVLLKRLTDFLQPEEKKQEHEEKQPERQKQSQKQVINIYTDGKVDSTHSNAKNIFIEPRSYAFPPKPILPTGYFNQPFLPSGNDPFMSTSSSTSSSSGLKPTDKLFPMPQKPVVSHLQDSIPLPQNIELPYDEDKDLQKTISDFEKMLGAKDEDEEEKDVDEKKDEKDVDEDSDDIKNLIADKKAFEEKLLEKKNVPEDEEMITYRKKEPDDPEFPYSVIKKKNIKKKI